MVDAGIAVPDELIATFEKFKLRHTHHWIIFKISDDKTCIQVDSMKDSKEEFDYSEFEDTMKGTTDDAGNVEPRFAVIDFQWTMDDGRKNSKLVFVAWVPENAKSGKKMLYASTRESFKGRLEGIQKTLQATDDDELEEENMLKTCK